MESCQLNMIPFVHKQFSTVVVLRCLDKLGMTE